MKKKINITIYVLTILLTISLGLSIRKSSTLKKEVLVMTDNVNTLGVKNSTLRLKVSDLKAYLVTQDSQHKITVDSILKNHKVKVKELLSYQKIKVITIDSDTVYLPSKDTKVINDSLHQRDYLIENKCVSVSLSAFVRDTIDMRLRLNRIETRNTVYITKSIKKTFWDKIFFRKGKEITTSTSDCGDVETETITVIK